MVLALIYNPDTANTLLKSASKLANQLEKEFGILSFVSVDEQIPVREKELSELCPEMTITVRVAETNQLEAVCEELDASFLFIQLSDSKSIRGYLTACRNLRIPYVLFKDSFDEIDLQKVMLPIGFLEEELEKAQFAAALGRFCDSEIKMLLANDYGSKAATNAERMQSLFDKFEFKYTLRKATKDSFKVEKEAVLVADVDHAGMIIVSASRDYGLDDIFFGPKEYHVVKKASIPVLLVNPRGDLYALCD